MLSSLFLTAKLLVTTLKKMLSPFASSAAVTNNEVALAILPPPSPASPTSDLPAGVSNLFCNSQEKCPSNLPLMGYSLAKKKGWCQMQLAGISPCDMGAFDNVDHSSSDDENDDYSPTPIYNMV